MFVSSFFLALSPAATPFALLAFHANNVTEPLPALQPFFSYPKSLLGWEVQ